MISRIWVDVLTRGTSFQRKRAPSQASQLICFLRKLSIRPTTALIRKPDQLAVRKWICVEITRRRHPRHRYLLVYFYITNVLLVQLSCSQWTLHCVCKEAGCSTNGSTKSTYRLWLILVSFLYSSLLISSRTHLFLVQYTYATFSHAYVFIPFR